jgi:nucleoside-diphosphate kinase
MEKTFSILKPDVTNRNITGQVNSIIEKAGLRIIAQKRVMITSEQAKEFYAEHDGKPFFDGLVKCMSSAPVVVQVLEGENAISKYRKIMGATNPQNAEPGTIRYEFARENELPNNSVHGSDSPESAKREISLFFKDEEIIG